MSQDEMAGGHHQCKERELGQTPGYGEGQGGLVCCSPWGRSWTQLGDCTATTDIYNISVVLVDVGETFKEASPLWIGCQEKEAIP